MCATNCAVRWEKCYLFGVVLLRKLSCTTHVNLQIYVLPLTFTVKQERKESQERVVYSMQIVHHSLTFLLSARNALVILTASVIVFFINKNGKKWFTMTGSIASGLPSFEPPKFYLNGTVDNGTVIDWGPVDIFKVTLCHSGQGNSGWLGTCWYIQGNVVPQWTMEQWLTGDLLIYSR